MRFWGRGGAKNAKFSEVIGWISAANETNECVSILSIRDILAADEEAIVGSSERKQSQGVALSLGLAE